MALEHVTAKVAKARPAQKYDVGSALQGAVATAFQIERDPVEWIEENLGLSLYTNQINDVGALFGKNLGFAVVAARGAGKTFGISGGLAAYCILYPGLRIIVAGPKEKQAGRIIKEITSILKDKKCRVAHEVDWANSSALRMQFKNGSYIVAVSGQETANVEGEHGHILVVDEAHKTPSFSITNKLMPMIGMLAFSKIVLIGVTMNKNFFFKFCNAEGAIVNRTPWYKAENFQVQKDVIVYKGRSVSRALIARMPLPYKIKYFPDRPDLQRLTGQELTVTDWETQYELLWLDDLLNFLSDEDQELMSDGGHELLTRGLPGEIYGAGLDTAQGSLDGRTGTDETVLSIWRYRKDGVKEKVATYVWIGKPLNQKREIFEIVNPQTGLFKCKMMLVDYSNIGIDIVHSFRELGIAVIGKVFGGTEPMSKKNWKNAMYDHYLIELQSNKIKYPNITNLEKMKISAAGLALTQIENCLRSFWEWCSLQRIRGRGLNDDIAAPKENIEGETGEAGRAYDDACSADILGVWALDRLSDLEQEIAKGGDLSTYQIPFGVIGGSTSQANMGAGSTMGQNPIARQSVAAAGGGVPHPAATPAMGGPSSQSWLSSIISGQVGK